MVLGRMIRCVFEDRNVIFEVQQTSLSTLKPLEMLDDDIINFASHELKHLFLPKEKKRWQTKDITFSFLSTFFYTKVVGLIYDTQKWFKKDTFCDTYTFIPVNKEKTHWSLLILDSTKNHLFFLDSLSWYSDSQDIRFLTLFYYFIFREMIIFSGLQWPMKTITQRS